MPKFAIIGAGPTGLGAAWRLEELGIHDWELFEADSVPGGLAKSFTDEAGFTWDLGGHVQFSHYEYFDNLMDDLLPDGWFHHERESWVWIRDRWVPYPFQFNIGRLPEKERWDCVKGLVELYRNPPPGKPTNFSEWIDRTQGAGLKDVFMRPYNYKVWAYPVEDLSATWVGERVAVVDLERVLKNIFDGTDDVSWGPNNTFRFPKNGGTGSIWKEAARRLPQERLHLSTPVRHIEAKNKKLHLDSGAKVDYEYLISSMPLDQLVKHSDLADKLTEPASHLQFSSSHIVGIGMNGQPPDDLETKCWMYFPEDNSPFYRVTVFSNYSKFNAPRPGETWSLMAEVSESPKKHVDLETVVEDCIQGALNTKLINSRDDILHTWHMRLGHGYPTPSVSRDKGLGVLLPELMKYGIWSRGRFGAWKYEVSNQDHSLMQGVEAVDHLVYGAPEMTVWYPSIVNGPKPWK